MKRHPVLAVAFIVVAGLLPVSVQADPKIIFDLPPEERYEAALALMGIDMAMLSKEAGHA